MGGRRTGVRVAFSHCTVERDSSLNIAECTSCSWGDTGIESGDFWGRLFVTGGGGEG